MKHILPLISAFAAFILFSCKKSGNNLSIVGNWQLINDSVAYDSANIGNAVSNYIGTSADYYDFTEDGHFYRRENNIFDTASYTITQGYELTLTYAYFNRMYAPPNATVVGSFGIRSLSKHNLTLVWAIPDGAISHGVINLRR